MTGSGVRVSHVDVWKRIGGWMDKFVVVMEIVHVDKFVGVDTMEIVHVKEHSGIAVNRQ